MAGHSLFSERPSQLTRIIPTQATSQALARPQAIRDATFFRFESLRFHSESAHRMSRLRNLGSRTFCAFGLWRAVCTFTNR
jgi:hypothetical protein